MSVFRASKAKKTSGKGISEPKIQSLANYVNSPSKSAEVWKETFGEKLTHPTKKVSEPVAKPQNCFDGSVDGMTTSTSKKTLFEETMVSENDLSSSQKVGVGQESELQPSAGSVSL